MSDVRLPFIARAVKPALTPEQQQRAEANQRRSAAIQAAPLKPKDGVTFAKKPGK